MDVSVPAETALSSLGKFGTHDLVKGSVFRELVTERDNDVAVEQKSFALRTIGYIRKLVVGNGQCFGKNLPVTGCLIEDIDEIGVLKNIFNLTGGEQVFDILCDGGRNTAPFTETLPDFNGVSGGLFFL